MSFQSFVETAWAVCTENGAPPFEQFFGHTALALALRSAGLDEAFVASVSARGNATGSSRPPKGSGVVPI